MICMKKIAFFSGDITRSGGTERVGTLIANGLAAQGLYEVCMVSLTEAGEEPVFGLSPKIRRTALSPRWVTPGPGYLAVIFRLKTYVKQNHIDLLIDIDGVLDVLSIPVKLLTGVRVISWEHFNYYETMGTVYRHAIRRLAARFADAIVTLTEQDKGFYLDNLTIRGDIRAIHNPADYLMPERDSFARSFEKKELLSVGGLVPAKGFLQVPLIAKRLKESFPSLEFVWRIAGEGEQRKELERAILDCGVEEQVKLLGHVQDVGALYGQALVYVMTSEHEGLPMVLLEAKRYGLPAVSFDIRTGPSEIIGDGVNGYLIPVTGERETDIGEMAEAIGRLLTDESLYHSFAMHTADHMEDFLMERILGEWNELLGEIIGPI